MSERSALTLTDLRVTVRRDQRVIVSRLSLDVLSGETVGIVGESGSGKSMAMRAIMGLLPPELQAEGGVRLGEFELLSAGSRSVARVRGTRITLILQDPFTMLNPLMRCGSQIVELVRDERGRRLRGKRARREAELRLAEVGIEGERVARLYPFQLSGGMRQRVGIAAALARDPEILIADEATTALDTTTQAEVLGLLKRIQAARKMAVVLITHDLRVAFSMCDRILVMYAGAVMETGPAEVIESRPLHPYTLALLLSEPDAKRRVKRLQTSLGEPRAATSDVSTGCPFQSRCVWAARECSAPIELQPVGANHFSACHRLDAISADMQAVRMKLITSTDDAALPAQGSQPLVSVTGLAKVYSRGGEQTAALRGVALEIREGEAVGLVGESGSGKTTLGRCLVGLERPSEGTIHLAGVNTTDRRKLTSQQRKYIPGVIQMVFQDPYSSLNPAHSVGSTLREALAAQPKAQRAIDVGVGDLLERVGLPASYARRKPAALSGGERQRVAIARALAVDPRVIVCDEAVSALDVSVQAQILNLLRSLQEEYGLSYLMISHDLAVIRQAADRVYVLQDGLVVEEGPVHEVLERPQHPHTRRLLDSLPRADPEWLEGHRMVRAEPSTA